MRAIVLVILAASACGPDRETTTPPPKSIACDREAARQRCAKPTIFCGWELPIDATRATCFAPDANMDLEPLRCAPCLEEIVFRTHTLEPSHQIKDLSPLASLPRLRSLVMEHADLRDLRGLGSCPITFLSLQRSTIGSLDGMTQLSRLLWVNLADSTAADLVPLAALHALETLELDGSAVRDLSPIAKLDLKVLRASRTSVSDLAALSRMRNLHTLELRASRVSDLSPLEHVSSLRRLDLRGAPVSDLTPLSKLSLDVLYLGGNTRIDLAQLATTTRMGTLVIEQAEVVNLTALTRIRSLRSVSLHGVKVDPSELSSLRKHVSVFID